MHPSKQVLGMDLQADPDDPVFRSAALGALVVVKAMDRDGGICYYTGSTPGLTSVEGLGMAQFLAMRLQSGIARALDEGGSS